ncbi:hypothetical protein [Terrisporobacter mayombei]|uniref:Uncharacterized protein n=1 Tax=Terrisporobacter mayombei TaxID=1541 RepID=A0ABY9Q1E6_9FIRM|nr:hypothetical protein [Terrisporobacter mayombei]MCC3867054.1 hypothetical protein [Terrisporobacter mayombei]WMT81313.1 hypothetical protein TEMA_16530 [Terrisporobacter mayombei]
MLSIEEIEFDLNRCEEVLKENDYMEIVIAIEELQDKYKNMINNISENENNVVWNYSKKDLEKIKICLLEYRKEMIQEEKSKNIDKKLKGFRKFIKENDVKYKGDLEETINFIEEVSNNDISLDEKYEELKVCFDLLKKMDRKISMHILELIVLVTK